jgi:hypothetical protein
MSIQRQKNKTNRNRKVRSVNPKGNLGQLSLIPGLEKPAYSGQYRYTFRIPGNPLKMSSLVTGTMAQVYGIGNFNTGNIQSWTTKWENLFDEYRIMGCDFLVMPISINAGGVAAFWFDEISALVPVIGDTTRRVVQRIQIAQTGQKQFTMKWRARDLNDLVYTDTAVDVLPAYFKAYTDTLFLASPAAVNDLFVVQPFFIVEFRGLKT